MFELADYSKRISDIEKKATQILQKVGIDLKLDSPSEHKIKLVFAGQYSAGKSTILKMLTGQEDIEIGAGITTQQAHPYEWNGIEVVDTPGIHTQLRPDHDAISYEAIVHADMLVFVVTNELFDSYIAQHFRKLAIDQDKAGEMILVVNKMGRTALGNIKEQQDIIKENLRDVLAPFTPEQLNISFLDAESYLDGIHEEDKELSDELMERSGYNTFIDTLNKFVSEKSIPSQLTTKIYRIEDELQKLLHTLEEKDDDDDINALEETYLQQRYELSDARNRLQQEIKDIFVVASSKIRNMGLETSNLLVDGCKQETVEQQFAESVNHANSIIEQCQNEAVERLNERLEEIGQSIENLENSEFANKLKARLLEKYETLPENVKNLLNNAGGAAKRVGGVLLKNAYNEGAAGGLKLANFAKGNVHDIVLKAGHAIGYKFKPWQAVKIAKGVAIGGQVLGVLGVGLEVFMQIKEDRDEEKREQELKNNRQIVRGQFYTAANELEDFGRAFVKDNVVDMIEGSINGIDDNINTLRANRESTNETYIEITNLLDDCQKLIRDIHQQ